jgi:hypothetical protein
MPYYFFFALSSEPSGTILKAPVTHSLEQMPQPLQ